MNHTHRDAISRHLDTLRAAISRLPDHTAPAWIALADLQREYDAVSAEEIDRAFGHGWRQGRDVGTDEGWKQRDAIARSELRDEQARTLAAQTQLEAARAELCDPIGRYQVEVEGQMQKRRQRRAARSTSVN